MPEPNYQTMPMDELRALTLAELGKEPAPVTPSNDDDQPRDDNGRFTKKEDAPVETAEAGEEVVYERTIDLGDGAGVQVFQGKTMEELVDNLAKAQEHATRKIREQQTQLRNQPKPAAQTVDDLPAMTEEQKFLLQQEMMTDPAKAIQRFVSNEVARAKAAEEADFAKQKADSEAFVANTPGYYKCEKNGQKLLKYLQTYNLGVSEENLKTAFEELNSSGLLETKPQETHAAPKDGDEPVARIEPTTTTSSVVRRKVVGGVSVKRSAPAPVQSTELTEKQLREMPMHELEALTRAKFMQGL